MSRAFPIYTPEMLRAAELFSAAAVDTLTEAETAELAQLKLTLAGRGVDVEQIADDADRILGEALVAMVAADKPEPMPADAKDRLAAIGERLIAPGVASASLPSMPARDAQAPQTPVAPPAPIPILRGVQQARPVSGSSWLGWTVAAAAVLVAALGWLRPPPTRGGLDPVPVDRQRSQLINEQGTIVLDWSSGPDPAGKSVKGDVVWNGKLQKGFIRFRGVTPNDPNREQYQLWIFDKQRADYPVDGGVFDVTQPDPTTGDIIIPIDAKLKVFDPALFAVTIEQSSGVVVTKKDRIVVTAGPKN